MPHARSQPLNLAQARLQVRHLFPGALALAGVAGFVNSTVLGFFHTPVSHMTGAVSRLGIDLQAARATDVLTSLGIIVGFLLGAILAGVMIGAWKLLPNRRYGVALMVEGALLGLGTGLLVHHHRLGLPAVAMACGLQNAMASSYCGLMIRTTHVSGMVTDIGIMLGHWLRHGQVEFWKLRFLASLFTAFGLGGWLGVIADTRFGPVVLAVPAVGCTVAGAVFWLVTHHGLVELVQDTAPQPPRTGSFPGR